MLFLIRVYLVIFDSRLFADPRSADLFLESRRSTIVARFREEVGFFYGPRCFWFSKLDCSTGQNRER